MDSGYLGPGDTLEDDYDVLRELLPDEVVGIMDQLLCTEVCSGALWPRTIAEIWDSLGRMVHGKSPSADIVLLDIHRQVTMAGTKNVRPSFLQA
jgi:hypothetical protein